MSFTVRSLTSHLSKKLAPTIRPLDQRWFEAELLVGHVLKHDRTWIALHPDQKLTEKQVERISELAERRAAHEPLAYLFKEAPFSGLTFCVNRDVLIPRPESERLVQMVRELIGTGQKWLIWDVGTGSGCLGLSIAHALPKTQVLLSDISAGAITLARKNAKRLSLPNTHFIKGSLLATSIQRWMKRSQPKQLCVVANLPYLPERDRPKMQQQVINYEPLEALFAKEDGLKLIRQLLQELSVFFADRHGNAIFLEHDPRQAKTLIKEAQNVFPSATVTTELDQNNAKRFTKILT